MKTGIFGLPAPMSFQEGVDYVKKIGVDAIEPYSVNEFATPDVEAARRLRDYAGEQGVDICCFSMGADFFKENPAEEVERLKRYADTAAAMGSPYLHHTLLPHLTLDILKQPFAPVLERAVQCEREVYDYAEQQGVRCVYEDQGFYFNGVQRFDDFMGAMNRNIGVVADLGNILFVGEKPEVFVARFAPLICHVHAKDYLYKDAGWPNPGERWYHTREGGYLRGTLVGHGVVNFLRVFSILREVGYNGYYSLEYDGVEEPYYAQQQSIANLRRFEKMAQLDSSAAEEVNLK